MTQLTGNERAKYVQNMFTRIAGRYDLMNRLMTGGQDIRWRKRVIELARMNDHASFLDLGTGTGTLARGFALRGCHVTGIDPSAQMLEQAKELDQQAGVEVEYRVAKAEATRLPDASFDIVTAGQCWHWFDRPTAAQEVKRILKPGGTIIIAHFDWLRSRGMS